MVKTVELIKTKRTHTYIQNTRAFSLSLTLSLSKRTTTRSSSSLSSLEEREYKRPIYFTRNKKKRDKFRTRQNAKFCKATSNSLGNELTHHTPEEMVTPDDEDDNNNNDDEKEKETETAMMMMGGRTLSLITEEDMLLEFEQMQKKMNLSKKKNLTIRVEPVSYTHLTLPTMCVV